MKVQAGDKVYIPAGALSIEIDDDDGRVVKSSVYAAVDPWLPTTESIIGVTSDQVNSIEEKGFPLHTVCCDEPVIACNTSDSIERVLHNQGMERRKYIAVKENNAVVGTIDLDHARGILAQRGVAGNDRVILVKDYYEPNTNESIVSGNLPLIKYILSAEDRPYRIVDLGEGKCGNIDVHCLQKFPARILLQFQFSHLELRIVQALCQIDSNYLEFVGNIQTKNFSGFGEFAGGPEKKIDRLYFEDLLREVNQKCSHVNLSDSEIVVLNKFRNHIYHGPRWYITRRGDVSCLVKCVKRIRNLIDAFL